MKPSFKQLVSSHLNSGRFLPLVRGCKVVLPTGEEASAKVVSLKRRISPIGLRVVPHAFRCTLQVGGILGVGFGESHSALLATQKAISEAFERAVLVRLRGTPWAGSTSSGWASHVDSVAARRSALGELLERDSILVHWLTQTPLHQVSLTDAPNWLRAFLKDELPLQSDFKGLKVLAGYLGHVPTATVVLEKASGGAVLSHAAGQTLEQATFSALIETCRIAQLSGEDQFVASAIRLSPTADEATRVLPEDHAMFYAHHEQLPDWFFGSGQGWRASDLAWKTKVRGNQPPIPFEFHEVMSAPLVVGFCTSAEVQPLFFGRTDRAQKRGLINLKRLEAVGGALVNLNPHCVA